MNNFFYCCILVFSLLFSKISPENPYIIQKEKGHIILAYKAFDDFLSSDLSWQSYKSIVLDPFPAVQQVHNRQIEWGSLDTAEFKNEIRKYKRENYSKLLVQYSMDDINYLYDTILSRAHNILHPGTAKEVDLCFFLPYGGCFVIPEPLKNTIFISLRINPAEAGKIMAHEYGHILHIDKRPEEPLTLQREIVSEGMAVYLTLKIMNTLAAEEAIPFMPPQNFTWCINNETVIRDSIVSELSDTTMNLFKRYISDGPFADPPDGFVQKTGYFAGYRIIERCISKGIKLEELCSLSSAEVVELSGYFKQ